MRTLPCTLPFACWLMISPFLARAGQALPHVDEIASNTSVFVDDPKFGKDPFFPKSRRRVPEVVTPVGAAPDRSALDQVLNSIVLKGVSGVPGKRLAMLNNRTVEAGEETEVKINNQTIRVRCVEVRDKSVVIGIEGTAETREIHLRQGIQ